MEKAWNSGEPSQEWPAYQNYSRAQWRLIQEVIKEPRTTSKELQASFASVKVSVHDSTIRKRQGKKRQSHCWPIRTQRLISHLPKNILIILKTFGQIFCGLMRQKLNFLEGVCPVRSGVKPTQNFIKRTSYQQSNMVVVVWWSGAALQLQDLDDLPLMMEPWILHWNPEGECPAISLWPQAHLGYAAGQWSQTHQQVQLWMAQKKTKLRFWSGQVKVKT